MKKSNFRLWLTFILASATCVGLAAGRIHAAGKGPSILGTICEGPLSHILGLPFLVIAFGSALALSCHPRYLPWLVAAIGYASVVWNIQEHYETFWIYLSADGVGLLIGWILNIALKK